MLQILRALLGRKTVPTRRAHPRPTPRGARPGLEGLEGRDLMSGLLSFTSASGVNGLNAITLSITGGNFQVLDNNVVVATQPVASTTAVSLTGAANAINT